MATIINGIWAACTLQEKLVIKTVMRGYEDARQASHHNERETFEKGIAAAAAADDDDEDDGDDNDS